VEGAPASAKAFAVAARDRVNGPSIERAICALGRAEGADETDLAVELLESPFLQSGQAVNDRLRRPPTAARPRARH
jgi:hypothetical protein